jgi:hypothetical protein
MWPILSEADREAILSFDGCSKFFLIGNQFDKLAPFANTLPRTA